MIELLAIILGIILGGLIVAWGLNARNESGELEQLRRFQQAMRAGGRERPLPPTRED